MRGQSKTLELLVSQKEEIPLGFGFWAAIVILFASASVFIAGLFSELCLGDEVYHFRFAKAIFNTGHRPIHDPLFPNGLSPYYFYTTEPIWNAGLALFWKLTGGITVWAAQLYQTCYFTALLAVCFLLGKKYYGTRVGFWACFFMATMPLTVSSAIILYTDLAGVLFMTTAFYLALQKKPFLVGVFIGLTFLTKRIAFFVAPVPFCLVLFLSKGTTQKLKSLLLMLLPVAVMVGWDSLWRQHHMLAATESTNASATISGMAQRLMMFGSKGNYFVNASLASFSDALKYFGLFLPLLLPVYFLARIEKRRDAWLWCAVLVHSVFYLHILFPNLEIRYYFSAMPFLSILCARLFASIKNKVLISLILVVGLFQFLATDFYLVAMRRISPAVREGFQFVKENTPPGSVVVYPEEVILERTDRTVLWGRFHDPLKFLMPADEAMMREAIEENGIDYIMVKKTRVYDDSAMPREKIHLGGYPKSLVEKLKHYNFLKTVFENQEIRLYQTFRTAGFNEKI